MPYGLPEKVIERLNTVLKEDARIRHVWLYGSRALGTFRDGSDIDLCVDAPAMQLRELFAIENKIDELLLPWKVDLVLQHLIDNPDLNRHIQRVGIPLWDATADVRQSSDH